MSSPGVTCCDSAAPGLPNHLTAHCKHILAVGQAGLTQIPDRRQPQSLSRPHPIAGPRVCRQISAIFIPCFHHVVSSRGVCRLS